MLTPDLAIGWIRKATGPLGDFRMPILIRILRKSGLTFSPYEQTLMIILSRYKEHVTFWGINLNIVIRELRELANALSVNESQVFEVYNAVSPHDWRQFLPQLRWKTVK